MKRKISAVILSVLLALSVAALTACDGSEVDTDIAVKPVSVRDVSSYPYTSYLPGEVFDITGLAIKVTMSNGRTGKYFDSDFTEWTHKDEPLTEDVTVITIKVPNSELTFDIEIFVGIPADSRIAVDTGMLGKHHFAGVDIDFSALKVKFFSGGVMTDVAAGEWRLFDGETEVTNLKAVRLTEGAHTFTVKYLDRYEQSFDLTANAANKAVYPQRFEAEDCCFKLGAIVHDATRNPNCTGRAGDGCRSSDTETNEAGGSVQRENNAEYWSDGSLDGVRVNNGSSGRGVSSALADYQNGLLVYFKFDVNVATAGKYKVKAVLQPMSKNQSLKGMFSINVNGAGYKPCSTDMTVTGGNRVGQYVDLGKKEDGTDIVYTSWLDCFWYTNVTLGTYDLRAGGNEIRMRMPGGFNGNIDYFEVTAADTPDAAEPRLVSMRESADGAVVPTDVTDGVVYLTYGQTLTDAVLTPELHPFKYTLLYLHMPDGEIAPVGGHMLSEIDYEKTGEQEVRVVCKKLDGTLLAITKFKLFIARAENA